MKKVVKKSRVKKVAKKAPKKTVRARAKSSVSAKKKTAPKKVKTLTIPELFALKKQQQQEQHAQQAAHPEQSIPPHELHDKAKLQPKPQGNTKIGRSGIRHQ